MSPETFRSRLLERGPRYIFEAVLVGAKPVLFRAHPDYGQWRDELAEESGLVSGEQVFLMGSALTGFSMAPPKYGRLFATSSTENRPASDLDVSVIDEQLFRDCWAATVDEDRRHRLRLTSDEKDKLKQDVYYGFIPGKVVPRSADVNQRILRLRAVCGRHPVSTGIRFRVRVYNRREDFVGYNIASLRGLRRSFENP
jgi:hypothetical protein